jgi:flagellar assembly protein FliH
MSKLFTFCELSEDGPDEIRSEFVCSYDSKDQGLEVPEQDTESRARKVFEDAYVQGEKAGHEMGMRKAEPLLKRLQAGLSELTAFKKELVKRSEELSTELALLFAETIVFRECCERKEAVAEMVRRALEICEEKTDVIVRVRSGDAEYLGRDLSVTVVADDTVKEPGFIIETNFGDIDGRVSTQIEELRKEFLNGCSS